MPGRRGLDTFDGVFFIHTHHGSWHELCVTGSSLLDRECLLALYWSSGGPRWTRQQGWAEIASHLKDWHGVKTNEQGRVVQLDLSKNNLSGEKGRCFLLFSLCKQPICDVYPVFLRGSHGARFLCELFWHSYSVQVTHGIPPMCRADTRKTSTCPSAI